MLLPLLALLACDGGPDKVPRPTLPEPRRVAMVGIDGGDWRILDPFIEAGLAPNLAKLRREGASAPLTIDSAMSPESWTTIASGHRPPQHGVVQDQLGTIGGGFFASNEDVKVHRVWDMATRWGRTSFVLDYWAANPAYPILGVLIPRVRGTSWPPDLNLNVADDEPLRHAEHIKALGLGPQDSGRARKLLQDHDFDLTILPYYGHDQGLHILYSEYAAGRDPERLARMSEEDAARARLGYEIIQETVRLADSWIEMALNEVGDDGYVVLFSDHGHTAAQPIARRLALGRTVLDGTPGSIEHGTIELSALGVGDARAVVGEQRRHRGSIEYRWGTLQVEGAQAPAAVEALLALRTASGDPVYVAGKEPSTVVPSPALLDACRQVLGRREEPGYSCFVNSGSHGIIDKGIFAVYGPDVVAGPMSVDVESVDVTPTVLWLMGLPTAQDLAGEPRTEVLAAERPVVTIPTYENGEQPWRKGPQDAPTDDAELMEWLKSMGYVE